MPRATPSHSETQNLRRAMRADRLASAKPVSAATSACNRPASAAAAVMRVHECLDIVEHKGEFFIACRKCSRDFGPATGNYKQAAVFRVIDKDELTDLPPPGGRRSMAAYIEYYCPGCATLLDVETSCAAFEGGKLEPIWDIQIAADAIHKAAQRPVGFP
jgi:Acetone carboxylase gamma subunit